MNKQRIIDLQKQLKIARTALEQIRQGTGQPEGVAADALDEMMPHDKVNPIAGLMGWEKRS